MNESSSNSILRKVESCDDWCVDALLQLRWRSGGAALWHNWSLVVTELQLRRLSPLLDILRSPSFLTSHVGIFVCGFSRGGAQQGGPAVSLWVLPGPSSLSCKLLPGSINSDTPSDRRDIKHKGADLFGCFTSRRGRARASSRWKTLASGSPTLSHDFIQYKPYNKNQTGSGNRIITPLKKRSHINVSVEKSDFIHATLGTITAADTVNRRQRNNLIN